HSLRHTRLLCAVALTETRVPALPLRRKVLAHSSARMHLRWLLDDQTIANQPANVLACTPPPLHHRQRLSPAPGQLNQPAAASLSVFHFLSNSRTTEA